MKVPAELVGLANERPVYAAGCCQKPLPVNRRLRGWLLGEANGRPVYGTYCTNVSCPNGFAPIGLERRPAVLVGAANGRPVYADAACCDSSGFGAPPPPPPTGGTISVQCCDPELIEANLVMRVVSAPASWFVGSEIPIVFDGFGWNGCIPYPAAPSGLSPNLLKASIVCGLGAFFAGLIGVFHPSNCNHTTICPVMDTLGVNRQTLPFFGSLRCDPFEAIWPFAQTSFLCGATPDQPSVPWRLVVTE